MEQISILNELYEKYKKNGKLSLSDKDIVKENLAELFHDKENKEVAIDFVIKYQEDIGIAAYIDHYKTLDYDIQNNLNMIFVNSKEFLANTAFKGINRGTALIGYLLKEKQYTSALFILKNVCGLTKSIDSKNIPNKVIEAFQKRILNNQEDDFLNMNLAECEDKDYYQIEKVIINSGFQKVKSQSIKPIKQYAILKWLSESGRRVKFIGYEKSMVQNELNCWSDEMKKMINADTELKNVYEGTINFEEIMNRENKSLELYSDNNSVEKINQNNTSANRKPKNKLIENTKQVNDQRVDKPECLQDSLIRIAKEVGILENNIKSKEEKMREILNSNQRQYEQKLKENEKLIQINNNYAEENTKLKSQIDSIRIQLRLNDEELKKLKDNEEEYKQKIETLLDIDAREDSNALKEFKNKLAGKLKYQYLDFNEVEGYNMNDDLGENFRIQIKEIFNILINQGIIFK